MDTFDRNIKLAMISGLMGGMSMGFDRSSQNQARVHKCLLKGCDMPTDHNKGYCSAECFKLSKKKLDPVDTATKLILDIIKKKDR